jgi:hypothetical protein
MTTGKRRCVTCQKDYDAGSPNIYAPLKEFEDWCICKECVEIYQKRKTSEKSGEH